MSLERWPRIEDLYHAALQPEPGARQAFLANVCHADEDLRREVQSLLDRDLKSRRPPSEPRERVAAELLEGGSSERRFSAGSIVGPYRIVEPLGASFNTSTDFLAAACNCSTIRRPAPEISRSRTNFAIANSRVGDHNPPRSG